MQMRKQFDHMLKMMGIRRPTRSAKAHGDPCARYETLLSSYTDGILDERKTALVEGHLNACAACRASLAATRLMSGALAHKPAPMFTGEMSARLRMALAAERERMPKHVTVFTAPRLAAIGASCAVVLAATMFFVSHGKHQIAPIAAPGNSVATNGENQEARLPTTSAFLGSKPVVTQPVAPVESPAAGDNSTDVGPIDVQAHPITAPVMPGKPKTEAIVYHPNVLPTTRINGEAPKPDVPPMVMPVQPTPSNSLATNDVAPAPTSNQMPAPSPAPAPQLSLVAVAPPAPESFSAPANTRSGRLMLASSVHLADQNGSGSSKVSLTHDLQLAEGSGTVSMVASNFH